MNLINKFVEKKKIFLFILIKKNILLKIFNIIIKLFINNKEEFSKIKMIVTEK
jgi:hypothetical protein